MAILTFLSQKCRLESDVIMSPFNIKRCANGRVRQKISPVIRDNSQLCAIISPKVMKRLIPEVMKRLFRSMQKSHMALSVMME